MDLTRRKQRSKQKNKATTYQGKNPTVLEATPSDDNNLGLEKDSDNGEEDMDMSWPDLFALQLLNQVNEQENIIEQEIPMLPNPLHKELLKDWIDIKHLDSETEKHPPISTNVGPRHKRIGSTRLRPFTFEFGASSQRGMRRASQRGMRRASQKVQPPPIRAQRFNAATHAPVTTPVHAPAPKRLGASPVFPSNHEPQIAPRRFRSLDSVSEPVLAPSVEHTKGHTSTRQKKK
ncbi:unnamed protein product [Lupinus luteus]|uniref:Uncharacterized protein n=1 Tax=Lupinus luteus TaxID=3873 RepID=A0AAV1WGS0_LUPLU